VVAEDVFKQASWWRKSGAAVLPSEVDLLLSHVFTERRIDRDLRAHILTLIIRAAKIHDTALNSRRWLTDSIKH